MTDDRRTQPGRLAPPGRRALRRGPAAPPDGPGRRARPLAGGARGAVPRPSQSPVPADAARRVPGAALPDRPGPAVRGRRRAGCRAPSRRPPGDAARPVGDFGSGSPRAAPAAAGERRRHDVVPADRVRDGAVPGRRRDGSGLFWMEGYAGGLFLPFRDATNGARDVRRRPLPARRRQERRPRRRRRARHAAASTSTSPTSRRARSTRAGPARWPRRRTGSTSRSAPGSGSPDSAGAPGAMVRMGRPDSGLSATPAGDPRPRQMMATRVARRAACRSRRRKRLGGLVRLFSGRQQSEERLIWSRDLRFIHTLAARVPSGRQIELEAGSCLIGPGDELTDALTTEVARASHGAEFGLVTVDHSLPVSRALRGGAVVGRPGVGPRGPDRDGADDAGDPDEDARLLLQPEEQPRGPLPADRGSCDRPRRRSPPGPRAGRSLRAARPGRGSPSGAPTRPRACPRGGSQPASDPPPDQLHAAVLPAENSRSILESTKAVCDRSGYTLYNALALSGGESASLCQRRKSGGWKNEPKATW